MNIFGKAINFRTTTGSGTVTPGDDLWEAMTSGDEPRLSVRQLSEQHWAVRSVVNTLARELASIAVEDRVTDAPAGEVMQVNRKASRGPMMATLIRPHLRRIAKDLARFDQAILVIVSDRSDVVRALVPLPPDEVEFKDDDGRYHYGDKDYSPDEILHIADELPAKSPLESLRLLLEEDIASSYWRKNAWETSPRGIVERPIEAPEISLKGLERLGIAFMSQLRGNSLSRKSRASAIPVLHEGESFNALELPDANRAQFVEGRRSVAESVASVYGVQGVLLASGENRQLGPARKQLIAGPVADMASLIAQACNEQLSPLVYGDIGERIAPFFNIPGKLASEDEDSTLTFNAVGRPWRSGNEQRIREGLVPLSGELEEVAAAAGVKTVVTEQ